MKAFYNTIHAEGVELNNYDDKAHSQQDLIISLFHYKANEYKTYSFEMTPYEVSRYFPEWPITSIRRAMTNLTKEGKLVKTNKQRTGGYGKPNYTWRLKTKQLQLL